MATSTTESSVASSFYAASLAPSDFGKNVDNLNTQEAALSILKPVETMLKGLLQDICINSGFSKKYDLTSPNIGEPYVYALTTLTSPYKFSLEVFPTISKPSQEALSKGPEEFRFHEVFETAIERYTETNAKPNAVLRETRSTDFCYPVTVTVEAVPLEKAAKPFRMLLLREFHILVSLWEQYRKELREKKCNIDQLVGFPMPFEFCIVSGTELDIPDKTFVNYSYYDISGAIMDFKKTFRIPLSENVVLNSTLSYMTTEKLGPSLTYLMQMLRTQSKLFSLSSALMVYDQLLCRLMVMHRYGVVHGDLNTDCLRFGSGNACNVLYISDFSNSVLLPSKYAPSLLFHDRFASAQKFKDKIYHFVHDFESAYYIFLLLAIGCLPWDKKIKSENRNSVPLLTFPRTRDHNPVVDMSATVKEKDSLWENTKVLQRLINSREFELEGSLYHNFTEDLMMSLHMKMKDIMVNCSRVSQETYLKDITNYGTVANNAYLGLRKMIASYFRFETLNAFLKDPATDAKIGILRSHDPEDRRVAWDLSSWCWNHIGVDMNPSGLTAYLHKTLLMQTHE